MKFYCDVYCDVYCVFYYIPAFSNLQKQTAKKIKRKWVIKRNRATESIAIHF